jgi:hypothetical protein
MIIYKTINLSNGKIYIGKDTKNVPLYLGSGKLLITAIKKYGLDNFKKEILEHCNSLEILNEREIFWISYYNSTDRNIGYNIAVGGTGGNTIEYHPNKQKIIKERNKKVSEGLKGHSVSKEARENQSKSQTGWFDRLSEDDRELYREKLSKKMKEYYSKNKHHSKDKKLSEEHKNKLSEIAKKNKFGGNTWSNLSEDKKNERSLKLSNSIKGRVLTEETKQKISNALKGKILSDETKNKISKTLKNKKNEK